MKNKFKRALLTAAMTSLPLSSVLADQTWVGTTSDMNAASNWTTAVPTSTDIAIFSTGGAAPTLTTPPLFDVLGIRFTNAAYNITADSGNTALNALINVEASGVNAVPSGSNQTFYLVGGAIMTTVGSSLDVGNSGLVTYNVGSNTDTIQSALRLDGASSAGAATINLSGVSTAHASFDINDTASLGSSIINATSFGDIQFASSTAASTAKISLQGSSLILSDNLAVSTLSSDSTSVASLGANTLTVNLPTGQTLSGSITGAGGSVVKNGPGLLTISNTTNSYSGTTTVNAGTLIGSTTSLSSTSSATVASGAALTFNDVTVGTFSSNITNNGTVNYIGTATGLGSEISGAITGTGQVVVNSTSPTAILRLSGANTYSGGTQLINGFLQVAPGSLPVAAGDPGTPSVTSSTGTILSFTGTQTYSGAITGNGQVNVASGGDLTLTGINNTYGETGIDANATLHVTAANLPITAFVGLNATTSLLDFTTTGTESFGAPIQGLGQVQLSGSEQLTLSSTNNTYTGGTLVNGGGTLIGNSLSIPVAASQPSITVSNSSTMNFNNTSTGTYTGNIVLTSATDILESTGSNNLTFAGNITGAGQLNVTGPTTLTGTGNTYSGGTNISSGGVLNGDTTSLQGIISLNNGILNFNQNIDGVFNGTLVGSFGNTINKNGTGTLILNTPNPFSGSVEVNQGILNLNSVIGANIFVNSGATLTGNGQIGKDLNIIGGTVSPGNSIGVIQVAGSYIQDSNGVYDVEITGAGQSDLIVVGGTAHLAGTVNVISLDGVINPAANYAIMHVVGAVDGAFDDVVFSGNPFIVGQVFYVLDTSTGATNAILKVETVFSAVAMTSNEEQVANQLNSITNPTPEELAIFEQIALIASTDPDAAAAALAQMSGQQYTNLIIAAELGNHQFLRRLYDPIRSIVTTYPCCQDYCCEPCPTLDFWVEGGGGRTFIEGTANTRGFHSDTWEVTGGVQSTFKRDWTIGLAGSYAHDQVSYNVGGTGKNQTGYAGLYGLYRPANWYVLADAAFGYSEHEVRRSININTLAFSTRAKPKIYQGSGYIEAGIDCPWNCFLVQPFLGFEAGYYDRQGFTETGASPLNLIVSKKSHTNVYSRLGAHITSNQLPWNISFSLDLAWQYRITSLGNSINERFESFGDTFTIKGLHFRNSSIDAAATISAVVYDNWEVYLEAAGERWSRASTYNFLGGVKFSW